MPEGAAAGGAAGEDGTWENGGAPSALPNEITAKLAEQKERARVAGGGVGGAVAPSPAAPSGTAGGSPPPPAGAVPVQPAPTQPPLPPAAGSEVDPPGTLLAHGATVVVDGLANATKYNGKRGIITSGLLNGRYAVWVESERKNIAIRPQVGTGHSLVPVGLRRS